MNDSVQAPSNDDRNLAMLAHLLGIVSGFIGALIIWLIKKDQSAFIDEQGKEALNFQITVGIAAIVCIALIIVVIGIPMLLALGVANLVFIILGSLKANKGEAYRYPFAFRFVK